MKQKGKYRLTNQQNNIYLLDSIYKDSGINNIFSWLEIDDDIDVKLMQKVANIIVEKNDCYRLRFNLEGNEPYQYVEEYKEFDVDVLYVKDEGELEKKIKLVRFDLKKDLPFKFSVFKYPNGTGGFVAIVHHLAGDAWTMKLVIEQILTFYYSLKNNIEIDEENYPSYIDYILSQEEFLNSDKKEKNQKYWEDIFQKPFDILSFKSKSNIGIDSVRREYMIDKDVLKSIRKFCEYNRISEYVFMLSVYSIYFGRIKNINRYVMGNPILNRSNAKEKSTSGLFMSTNPFVVEIDPNTSFLSFAKKLQQDQKDMYRHLKYDYKQLVKYINEKNNNYDNIYDVVFSYQNAKVDKEIEINTKSRWVESNKQVESLMIHLKDTDDTGDILFAYDYLTDVFTKEEIDLMHKRIEYIISQVLENRFIKYIDIVPKEEKERLLCEYNDTYYEYNRNETIVSVFEKMCEEQYDKTALIFGEEKISYRQLNKKANQLARALKNIGVQSGDIVAVVDSRSTEMFVSMLAILKLGAGYVPIDIEYPKDRIEYIIKNANCKVCVTKRKYSDKFATKGMKIFSDDEMIYTLLGENIFTYIPSSSIAYMIYTSGSTGNPKGVMITHNNVINFINGTTNEINFINKTIVSVTTISFDIFVLESWLALSKGCTVVIANEQEQNIPILLNKLCLKNDVKMIQTTPSRIKLLMSDSENMEFLTNMTDIMIGGESVPYSLVQELKKITKARIYNMYGPTETTVWSTIKNLTKDDKITIGKPIANTGVYIFDSYMNLCPINVEGNIYIGGDGLSAGYYKNTDLTNEKFIHNPLVKNQYIYMTGDVGKWNNDGNLECLGRTDFQVKLHGHRIELGEIENTILKFEDIKEASVLCVNNETLYAYFTSRISISTKELKKYLQEKLPAYMIPSKFMQIDNMPKTPNGKIDKKALKDIKIEYSDNAENNQVEPKTEIEKTICTLVSEILSTECKDIEKNIFALGMDSLNVIDLCNRIIKKYSINITVKDIFELQTIANISNKIEGMVGQNSTESIQMIPKTNDKKMYKATTAQTRIYFASQMKKDSVLYNMPYAMILEGQFNIYNFKTAINEIIKRQVSLQISFELCDGVLYQKVNNISEFEIEVEKIKEDEIDEKYREFVKYFDFSKAPLMRIKVLQISKTKHVLLFDMHHIISDGMSLHILANEISQIYEGQKVDVSQLSFVDYAQYESQMIEEDRFNKEKEYWLNEFSNLPEPLDMPYDYKKDGIDVYVGKKLKYCIEGERYKKIQLFAQENDVTPNVVLFSVYYILLARYSKMEDIVVGLPIANRDNVNLQNSIGLYANELPVRINVNEEYSFKEFLKIVKDKVLNVLDNSNYPNGQILQLLKKNNINAGNTLFDTMFIFQNKGMPTLNLSNIQTLPYVLDSGISKYNFSMEILDENDRYDINVEYATELFKDVTIKRFLKHYINILNEVLLDEKIKLEKIQMLGQEEIDTIIQKFNDTQYNFDIDEPIHKMISDRANRSPNDIALVFENYKLTYMELEQKTNSLAKLLRDKGVGRSDVIGIMVPRSLEMLVGIIAVLKSGASYMPVDISYPKDRIEYMLENSNAKFVLVCDDNFDGESKYININLKQNSIYENKKVKIENVNSGEDVAYLIYTSGSTGKPKGVMVKHKGVTNLVHYCNDNIELFKDNVKRKIVSVTTMSFDIFVFETLIALQKGLTVVVANEDEQRIPSKLNTLIEKNNVDIIQTTPSRMQMLVDYKEDMPSLKNLKYVVLIGEPYKDALLKDIMKINPNIISYNTYGPTETTVLSTSALVNVNKKINIGKPIYNTQIYILDTKKRLVPIGQVGELYIGGQGVSKGYKNNKELTNEKFINNPFVQDDIIYQTGDLARWLDNGELECLGRTDSQVKIRGLRIELEEIENVILKSNTINQVVVVEKEDNQNRQYLSAYFTANEQVEISEIRQILTQNLPAYMIPTHIEQLQEFVYTPNGKIDKKPLKKKKDEIKGNETKIIIPKTQLQEKLLKIYKEILGVDSMGITDNFFDMGGDSILAMKLQIQLLKENIEVTYGDIFNFPTVELLEQRICTEVKSEQRKEKISIPINKYDSVLNNVTLEEKIKKNKFKGVILTGATGYVGMHILANLLDNKVKTVYCLVRPKDNKSGYERLKEKLHFYFSTKYDKYMNKKIIVIETDVTKQELNFTKEMYKKVSKTNVIFINALANVSHYGEEKEFYSANVESVKNIVKFCKECNKKLFHISTISVSGNALVDQTYMSNDINGEMKFKENNLYIKQPLNNVYIKTKFMAEQIILDNIMQGLNGYILRLGNIMGRYSDGHFQQNVNDNAYVNRLKAIYNLGVIPEYIKGGHLEFTPVDCLAKAITKIVLYNNDKNRIFHLFNNKYIAITKFINICEKLYKKIDILPEDEFNKKLYEMLKSDNYSISFILNDLNKDKKLQYESNIKIDAEFTNRYLRKTGFEWPEIEEEYIKKFFDYLFSIDFFRKE